LDKLWAPWRIKYVSQKRTKYCIFCQILGEKNDKKNFILLRSSECFAVLNTFPYNNGHTMVVSNRHARSLEDLKDNEIIALNKMLIKIKTGLTRVLKPDGYNIGINLGKSAGAGIANHLHVHIVPRWIGDTNFMPVMAETKIISQSLKELYRKLKKEL
jgi:ATP adenylyltransferase